MSYTLPEAPEAEICKITFPHFILTVLDSTCRLRLSVPPAIGGRQYPPQSAPNQAPQGTSDFVDGSGPIFSMYMKMATEDDEKMAENWKADADGILIFVRPYR